MVAGPRAGWGTAGLPPHPHGCSTSTGRSHTRGGPESRPDTVVPQAVVCMVSSGKPTCLRVEKLPLVPMLCADTVDVTQEKPHESARTPGRHESQESCSAVRTSPGSAQGQGTVRSKSRRPGRKRLPVFTRKGFRAGSARALDTHEPQSS